MRWLLCCSLCLVLNVSSAMAAPPEAAGFVHAKIDELADLLTSGAPDRLEQVRRRMQELTDFSGFSERALGPTWGTLTRDEQLRFQRALQRLLESHYMGRPASIFDKQKVQVKNAVRVGEQTAVHLAVRRADADIDMVVELRALADRWQIRDVTIDGLSLLEDYRAQFQTYLKKKSLSELIAKLESRAQKNLTAKK